MDTAYVATFYTHYDAILFHKQLQARGVNAELAPVPRALSSSCGTCVRFCCAPEVVPTLPHQDAEQLARAENNTYRTILDRRRDS